MNRLWYAIAASAALLAMVPALVWPNRPRWERAMPFGNRVLDFAPDGRLFVLADANTDGKVRPSIVTLDGATGQLLDRVPVAEDIGSEVHGRLAPDGRHALLWDGSGEQRVAVDTATGRASGRAVTGCADLIARPFSDDGRFYVAESGDGGGVVREGVPRGWLLIETATGDVVAAWGVQCRNDPAATADDAPTESPTVRLAPDGRTVAVWWSADDWPEGSALQHDRLELIDVPTLRVIREVVVPPSVPGRFVDYDGRRAYFNESQFANGGRATTITCHSVDVTGDNWTPRREPTRDGWGDFLLGDEASGFQVGPGWVARPGDPPAVARVRDRILKWLRVDDKVQSDDHYTLVVCDAATGRTRGAVSINGEATVSADGRYVAAQHIDERLRVWDVAPPRTAWAMVTGGSTALAVVGVRLAWRRRTLLRSVA